MGAALPLVSPLDAVLAGATLPIGSAWFGFSATPRVLARFDREGFDAVQVAGDVGAALAYPDCGWELL